MLAREAIATFREALRHSPIFEPDTVLPPPLSDDSCSRCCGSTQGMLMATRRWEFAGGAGDGWEPKPSPRHTGVTDNPGLDPPRAHPGGSLPGLPPGELARSVATAPVSLRGVAPNPGRVAGTLRGRRLAPPSSRQQQKRPVTGAPCWAMSLLGFLRTPIGTRGNHSPDVLRARCGLRLSISVIQHDQPRSALRALPYLGFQRAVSR
jgi:hypothetical protein